MKKNVAFQESFLYGWSTTFQRAGIFMFAASVLFSAIFVGGLLFFLLSRGEFALTPLIFMIFILLPFFLLVCSGFLKISLKQVDGYKILPEELFSQGRYVVQFFWVYLFLFIVFFAVFFLLFYIPQTHFPHSFIPVLLATGLFVFSARLFFAPLFVIDRKAGAFEALKGSAALTSGNTVKIGSFFALIIFLNVLGSLAFVVGLIFTIPTSFLATAFAYRGLIRQSEIASPVELLKIKKVNIL